ncbi:hypothetical protein FVE85_7990 [Porphyridium purpureum]|uniref:Uncharacterized protein n=1 Tax=Porphyridium purpureum TaxID=35688 RepID=A0A5J4YP54_PORPP|nr:hypothetical protein FVE85_7990 [Porphyridium purpureum]|eukprot:POR5944..scf295_9
MFEAENHAHDHAFAGHHGSRPSSQERRSRSALDARSQAAPASFEISRFHTDGRASNSSELHPLSGDSRVAFQFPEDQMDFRGITAPMNDRHHTQAAQGLQREGVTLTHAVPAQFSAPGTARGDEERVFSVASDLHLMPKSASTAEGKRKNRSNSSVEEPRIADENDLREERSRVFALLDAARAECATMSAEIHYAKSEAAASKMKDMESQKSLIASQGQIRSLMAEKSKLEASRHQTNQRIASMEARVSKVQALHNEHTASLERIKKSSEEYAALKDSILVQVQDLHEARAEFERRTKELSDSLDTAKASLTELESEKKKLEDAQSEREAIFTSQATELEASKSLNLDWQNRYDLLSEELKQITAQQEKTSSENDELNQALKTEQQRTKEAVGEIEALSCKLHNAEVEACATASRERSAHEQDEATMSTLRADLVAEQSRRAGAEARLLESMGEISKLQKRLSDVAQMQGELIAARGRIAVLEVSAARCKELEDALAVSEKTNQDLRHAYEAVNSERPYIPNELAQAAPLERLQTSIPVVDQNAASAPAFARDAQSPSIANIRRRPGQKLNQNGAPAASRKKVLLQAHLRLHFCTSTYFVRLWSIAEQSSVLLRLGARTTGWIVSRKV